MVIVVIVGVPKVTFPASVCVNTMLCTEDVTYSGCRKAELRCADAVLVPLFGTVTRTVSDPVLDGTKGTIGLLGCGVDTAFVCGRFDPDPPPPQLARVMVERSASARSAEFALLLMDIMLRIGTG
jgi:hypothetical protein